MKQAIVFAFYKNDQLLGYRLDTVGSIGFENPKIYHYSTEQVQTVLDNIQYNITGTKSLGKALGVPALFEREKAIKEFLREEKAFEVRVIKCPDYIREKEFNVEKGEWVEPLFGSYPLEEMKVWLRKQDEHEVIETHILTISGKVESN